MSATSGGLAALALAAVSVGCGCRSDASTPVVSAVSIGVAAPAAKAEPTEAEPVVAIGEPQVFSGACDPSGAVPLDRDTFAVADDEDNTLRIYDASSGGAPIGLVDLGAAIHDGPRDPEADLEGATRIGNLAFWVASHARRKSGRADEARMLFVATALPAAGAPIRIIGEPYRDLQRDLIAAPALSQLALDEAAQRRPGVIGGLNIEGLTATPDGELLLGFRNPVPDGLALIVPINNPTEIGWGARAELGVPIRLDLGGLGIRALSWWRGQYLIIGGPPAQGTPAVYAWRGPGHPARRLLADLGGLNPEAFFTPEEADEILLLSDDGTFEIDGRPCKRLDDSRRKRFRALRLTPY